MTVAVAVVSFNSHDRIRECLESLRDQADEVWVVDNASDDGTAAVIRDEFPWVHLVASSENLGYGRAVNLVAERTRTEWLAAANDDVVLERGALQRLLLAAAPATGAIAPRLVLRDGSTQHSVHPFPSPAVAAAVELGGRRVWPGLAERWCLPHAWDPERERDVPWAIGAFLVLRRAAFDAVGGFDPSQWMYAEDLSLGWRLRRAGWTTRYVPSARVQHRDGAAAAGSWGSDRTPREMEATYAWMHRAQGGPRTAATAVVGWTAHTVRAAVLSGPARDRARYWRRIHARGLRG